MKKQSTKKLLMAKKPDVIRDYKRGIAAIAICRRWEIGRATLYRWVKPKRAGRDYPLLAESRDG
jgi:transposase-like protein